MAPKIAEIIKVTTPKLYLRTPARVKRPFGGTPRRRTFSMSISSKAFSFSPDTQFFNVARQKQNVVKFKKNRPPKIILKVEGSGVVLI